MAQCLLEILRLLSDRLQAALTAEEPEQNPDLPASSSKEPPAQDPPATPAQHEPLTEPTSPKASPKAKARAAPKAKSATPKAKEKADPDHNLSWQVCPVCRAPMKIKKAHRGGMFYGCTRWDDTQCDGSRQASDPTKWSEGPRNRARRLAAEQAQADP